MALQDAFGWTSTHSYDFAAVVDPSFDPATFDMFQFMQNRMAMSQPGAPNMNPESTQREYVMRVKPKGHGHIDSMHEGQRRYPRTLEKPASQFKVWQMFDNEEWKGMSPLPVPPSKAMTDRKQTSRRCMCTTLATTGRIT